MCLSRSSPSFLPSFSATWRKKLVTREDPLHLHKTLGLFVLISYAWRFSLLISCGPEADMGFASHPSLTEPSFVLHMALHLSSLVFRIPQQRIRSDGGRIWPEYRWHSFIFAARCWIFFIINNRRHQHQQRQDTAEPPSQAYFMLVMATLVAADVASYSVTHRSNSVRELQAPPIAKYAFSLMQFYATSIILVGTHRNSVVAYMSLVIQISPFLLTLRRKNLVSHVFNVTVYGLMLLVGFSLGFYETVYQYQPWLHKQQTDELTTSTFAISRVTAPHIVSLVACTVALWRMAPWPQWLQQRYYINNKYVVWMGGYYCLFEALLHPFLLQGTSLQQNEDATSEGIGLTVRQVQRLAYAELVVVLLFGAWKHSGRLCSTIGMGEGSEKAK